MASLPLTVLLAVACNQVNSLLNPLGKSAVMRGGHKSPDIFL